MASIRPTTRSSAGFTLIELLLVFVILALLMQTVIYGVQTFGKNWRRQIVNHSDSVQSLRNLDLLASTVHSLVPLEAKNDKNEVGFYFLGSETGFTGVTDNGILNAGKLSVFRVLKEANQDGTFSLFYEEAPLNEYPLVYANQNHSFNFRLQIVSKVSELSFRYLGWESYDAYVMQKASKFTQIAPIWYPAYDGMVRFLQPSRIRIKLDQFEWEISVAERSDFLISRRANHSV